MPRTSPKQINGRPNVRLAKSASRTPPAADAPPALLFSGGKDPQRTKRARYTPMELVVEITLRDRLQGRLPCY